MTLCSPWIDGADVAACCNVEDASDTTIFDGAAELASELLFYYSMRRFPGVCGPVTARPCRSNCSCPWQILSRGHIVWNWNILSPFWGWWTCGEDQQCGCAPLSRVQLAGRVQEIIEVKIDGAVVDPATYRVDQRRWLTRVRETSTDELDFWPGCQFLDLEDDQPGTWSVTYTYGEEVPISGQEAASELACNIYKQCNGQPCQLPANTVRVARQGIIAEKPAFVSWGFEKGGRSIPRGWNTGMPRVDAFLNAYNPTGVPRVPIFWSPTARLRYAPTLGLPAGS
jgi:hypothetical protein